MLENAELREIKRFGKQIQIETVRMIGNLGVGHIGGSLSIADVLSVLYGKVMKYNPADPRWEDRDWLVLSKGHSGPGLYAALALKGFFPMEELMTLNKPGTRLPSHCDRNLTPGIDMTTGSLGQGSSLAAGVALSHKIDKMDNWIYLILGDGELQEGQVWEMAMFAAQQELDNLIAFVDSNGMQVDGYLCDICDMGDIAGKFEEFGWHTQQVDGHNVAAMYEAIEKAKTQKGKPSLIVLNTIKGHGWSLMAGKPSSHNASISKEQMEAAISEMEADLAAI
ncbi:MAG: transketolase [Saccharofermentanales bacterium]